MPQSVRHFATMKRTLQFALALAVAVVFVQRAGAALITGSIGLNGSAAVDTGDANTASTVVSWGTTTVGSVSGTFQNFGGGIPTGTQTSLSSPLYFYATMANPLFQVDGFTFSLWNSAIFAQGSGMVKLFIQGNMMGNGYASTPYAGWLQITDPASAGAPLTANLSLVQTTPDAGSTMLLLGGALAGLTVIRRKLAC